jgi:type 1 glutamine amidotransferase
MRSSKAAVALIGLALLGVYAFSIPAYAQARKVVFVAAPKDHGVPGRHEYEKDLRVLAYCLEHSSNLTGITTKVYVGKAPGIDELKDAAVIVVHGDGDRSANEHNPLFPANATTDHGKYSPETTAYLKDFDELMKKGVGLVVFHYTTEIENETARQYYMDWVGGYYASEPGVRNNPVDQWTMTLQNEGHPVLRGVHPWNYKEEIFTKFQLSQSPQLTPLIVATPDVAKFGPRVASWAYQRKEGGRGFVFGGMDMHSNLLLEDPRRVLLNGIVWAARMEVPAGGVASTVSEDVMK